MGKRKYSLCSNIKFMLVMLWNSYRPAVFFSFLAVITGVARPYLNLLLPKIVVDQLTANVSATTFILAVGGTALLLLVFQCLDQVAESKVGYSMNAVLGFAALEYIGEKVLDMDYELSEDPKVCKLRDRAQEMSWGSGADGTNLIKYLSRTAMNILGLIVYGNIIFTIHPLIAVLLLIGLCINMLMIRRARKFEERARKDYKQLYHRIRYINQFFSRSDAGKDIRLYSLFGWLMAFITQNRKEALSIYSKMQSKYRSAMLVEGAVVLLRDGAAYVYLIYLVLQNQISLGDFLLVFGAVGSFAGWVSGVIDSLNHLLLGSAQVSDFQRFYNMPDKMKREGGEELPQKSPVGFCFDHVSYFYPDCEKAVIENMNLNISAGEKIAVVGVNGAGKTTFVKLLCGLYQPSEGTISLEGTPVNAYNRDEYYTLFSAVFQDIYLITDTIACNVSQQKLQDTDMEKVISCLKIAGLFKKVESLPDGLQTQMVKSVNKDGIELSGGELQKLALARALYKKASVMILDEPTAALDPLAESEVYQKYAEMTEGVTSIFISHRLASTRFCDRILLLDGGKIAEEGTHDELMALNGIYANMFEIQSSYYKEERPEMSDEGIAAGGGLG